MMEPLIHPYILVAFQELNSGILVNKFCKYLFTSLPFLHRNLFRKFLSQLGLFLPNLKALLESNQINWLS
jgi:hypothetical protein